MTQDELARACGVSSAAVSRVLAGDSTFRISDEMRQRILCAADKLRYVHNQAARTLTTGKGHLVCLPAPVQHMDFLGNAFSGEILRGIRAGLESTRYELSIQVLCDDSPDVFEQYVVRQAMFAGVVFFTDAPQPAMVRAMNAIDLPFVLVGSDGHVSKGIPLVYSDSGVAFRELTQQLIDKGHRRIAFVGYESVGAPRRKGYEQAMTAAGLSPLWVLGRLASRELLTMRYEGHALGRRLLETLDRPTAVVCSADAVAFGVVDALREAGIKPGADVDVVGYDDIESLGIQPFGVPTLSTMQKPRFQMGRLAIEMLLAMINGSGPPQRLIQLPGQWIERDSCRLHRTIQGDHS